MGIAYSAVVGHNGGGEVAPPFPRRAPSPVPSISRPGFREEALLLGPPPQSSSPSLRTPPSPTSTATSRAPSLLSAALHAAAEHERTALASVLPSSPLSPPSSPELRRPRVRLSGDRAAAVAADDAARAALRARAFEGLAEVRFGGRRGLRADGREAAALLARHRRTLRSLAFVACLDLGDAELGRLRECVGLVSLTLDGCVQVTDEGVTGIAELRELRRLSLKGCKQIVAIGEVVGRLSKLEVLSLECCVAVEDEQLEIVLRRCTSLRVLCMAHCFRVTSRPFLAAWRGGGGGGNVVSTGGLARTGNRGGAAALDRFVKFDVRCTQVSDTIWPIIGDMVRLRSLLLGGTNVTDFPGATGISLISRLGDLRQLGVERTVVGDGVLAAAEMLPHLETLDLAYAPVSDMAIARHVSKMRTLRWLSLEETAVTDYALERLAGLVELRHLDIGDTAVSSFGLRALSPLTQLRSINLAFTDVRCCKGLSPLVALESVALSSEQRADGEGLRIGDDALVALAKLPMLRELELYAMRISNEGLVAFCASPAAEHLRMLDVNCCGGVGNVAACHGIARLHELEELNLSQTAVSDEGVITLLAALPKLRELNLSYTDITNAAIDAAKGHVTLQRVTTQGCNTPPQPRTSVAPADALAPVLRLIGT